MAALVVCVVKLAVALDARTLALPASPRRSGCAPSGIEFIRYLHFSLKHSVLMPSVTPHSSTSGEFRAESGRDY
jgi:hypothetical protein